MRRSALTRDSNVLLGRFADIPCLISQRKKSGFRPTDAFHLRIILVHESTKQVEIQVHDKL